MVRETSLAAVVLLGLWLPSVVRGADPEAGTTSRAELLYRVHCLNCHGERAKGDGPLREFLTVRPADLTRLRRDAEGRFPVDRVVETIDGRRQVRGHGSREMPVWGITFQDTGRNHDQEEEVRHAILELARYLESLQEERTPR